MIGRNWKARRAPTNHGVPYGFIFCLYVSIATPRYYSALCTHTRAPSKWTVFTGKYVSYLRVCAERAARLLARSVLRWVRWRERDVYSNGDRYYICNLCSLAWIKAAGLLRGTVKYISLWIRPRNLDTSSVTPVRHRELARRSHEHCIICVNVQWLKKLSLIVSIAVWNRDPRVVLICY